MRLINVHTLVISEFHGNRIPRYAILSHTWDEEEVTLQDMRGGIAPSRKGYRKIELCCEQARFDGLPYAWIDTCCIDKQSSAELSEAINSMYRWYENATLCYAYLADVEDVQCEGLLSFKCSRYWTRGWTLQELIAPNIVIFFSSSWIRIGTRLDLRQAVAEATSIPRQVLRFRNISDYSVSQKMSWASRRYTTRIEDEAYCLLGLFGVAMPLLYGEGRRAFRRLQEEIIKELDDESIFAWQGGTNQGLLASCPAQYTFSHSIQRSIEHPFGHNLDDLPFAITNRGVRISLPILEDCYAVPLYSLMRESSMQYLNPEPPPLQGEVQQRVLAILNCQQGSDVNSRIAVILNHDQSRQQYARIGLVKVSIDDVLERATLKRVLVAAGENPWGATWVEEDPERLVVIQRIPNVSWRFKFERATLVNGIEVGSDIQENGAVSIRFRQSRPLAAIYRAEYPDRNCYVVIYLKLLDAKTGIDASISQAYGQDLRKEAILEQTAQDNQHFLSGKSTREIVYEIDKGTITLSLNIREAEHASVVQVNAELQPYLEIRQEPHNLSTVAT
ncbi:heterokaryon incompatibility protein-domain-containing protein [Xylaria sp. FL0933]|nr:heterokaryon incompatibility protein-domain-containing protein [Xylaria sp. FL0933]